MSQGSVAEGGNKRLVGNVKCVRIQSRYYNHDTVIFKLNKVLVFFIQFSVAKNENEKREEIEIIKRLFTTISHIKLHSNSIKVYLRCSCLPFSFVLTFF